MVGVQGHDHGQLQMTIHYKYLEPAKAIGLVAIALVRFTNIDQFMTHEVMISDVYRILILGLDLDGGRKLDLICCVVS